MELVSPSFEHHQPIPSRHAYGSDDLSPPLRIVNPPEGAKSYVLIVDDPDAPKGTWVHWVVWNIPGNRKSIAEGESFPDMGKNDFGNVYYNGPYPPPGKAHRYFFKLYAVDTTLTLPRGATKEQVLKAIEGHVMGQAELVGTFKRS